MLSAPSAKVAIAPVVPGSGGVGAPPQVTLPCTSVVTVPAEEAISDHQQRAGRLSTCACVSDRWTSLRPILVTVNGTSTVEVELSLQTAAEMTTVDTS